jgi:hypothetical protein
MSIPRALKSFSELTAKAISSGLGRGQVRSDYKPDEIESPTASTAAIFPVAQLAAAEKRFVMVGDVGSAYLNARLPMDKPDKILHLIIQSDVADEIIRRDKSFSKYKMKNGNILVRLNKALYDCIESAKLWYEEIAGTLKSNGFIFTTNASSTKMLTGNNSRLMSTLII